MTAGTHEREATLIYATLIISIVLVLFTTIGVIIAVTETSRTFTNSLGPEVMRSTTNGSSTTFKDSKGQELGRSEQRGPVTNYYNNLGQSTGTARSKK